MQLKSKEDIVEFLQEDNEMIEILEAVQSLHLPDWWVCAGIIRSKVWDKLHAFQEKTTLADVDVIYFDRSKIDEEHEKKLESKLRGLLPEVPWSVKNQARMHHVNGIPPYKSSIDGMAKFPETATALGVTLDDTHRIILAAPHGIEDLINMHIRPTPLFKNTDKLGSIYNTRMQSKDWPSKWPKVSISFL